MVVYILRFYYFFLSFARFEHLFFCHLILVSRPSSVLGVGARFAYRICSTVFFLSLVLKGNIDVYFLLVSMDTILMMDGWCDLFH